MGTGKAEFLERVTFSELVWAAETWVAAAKPVMARATTKARTMFFMMFLLGSF
jgi:hypothetical protein